MELSNNNEENKTSIYRTVAIIVACALILAVIGGVVFLFPMNNNHSENPQRENMTIKNVSRQSAEHHTVDIDTLGKINENPTKKKSRLKKVVIAGGIVVLVAAVAFAGYYKAYHSGDIENPSAPSEEGETGKPIEGETGKPIEGETSKPIEGETSKPIEGETSKPIEGETSKPIEGVSEKPIEGVSEKPIEGATDKSIAGATENPEQTTFEKTFPESTGEKEEVKAASINQKGNLPEDAQDEMNCASINGTNEICAKGNPMAEEIPYPIEENVQPFQDPNSHLQTKVEVLDGNSWEELKWNGGYWACESSVGYNYNQEGYGSNVYQETNGNPFYGSGEQFINGNCQGNSDCGGNRYQVYFDDV